MTYEALKQNTVSTYGSDLNGMVWGYRFVPGQPAEPISSETAADILAADATDAGSDFLWLHFSLSNSSAEPWLRRCLTLPEAFYESMKPDVAATRLEREGEALVGVFHDVLYDFKFDASETAATSVCIQPRLMVSARLRPVRSIDRVRNRVRDNRTFRTSVELLAFFLEEQAFVLSDIVRQASRRVDQIEDQLLAGRLTLHRTALGSLRRVLVRLRRLMAPEPAALFRLLHRPPRWIAGEDLAALRQAAEEFSVTVGDTAALVERIKLLQEELTARVSEQTGRTLFVLTLVTVLALPINLAAGLFGMNVGGIPLVDAEHGFATIVLVLLTSTGLLGYLALEKFRK